MDFNEMIEQLQDEKVIDLMTKLGADRYKDTGSQIIFPTICHNVDSKDASMKLYYYKDNHFFYCYTNCGGMSIFKFLQTYYEERGIEYNWYQDIYKVIESCSLSKGFDGFQIEPIEKLGKNVEKRKRIVDLPVFSEGVLDVFTKIYPAQWLEEGISTAAMDKFNILFSISQNKIIIPHYNVKGELVGIRGRALNEWEVENVGKYMPIKIENIWYNHRLSLNLYGLNANKENIKKNGYVILVEGEKSVMQAESFKRENCTAAVCGSNINKFQIEILMKECSPREIIIAFDNEEEKGQSTYFDKLYAMCKKYSNYADFSFIYDKYNLTKKKDSPFDEGEETFNKLLEKRVKVK